MNTLLKIKHFLAHMFFINDMQIIHRYDKNLGKVQMTICCRTCGKSCINVFRSNRRFGLPNRRSE